VGPLLVGPLLLASCSSGGGSAGSSATPDDSLKHAGTTVQAHMAAYLHKVGGCQAAPTPVVCVEAADRTLGGQVHAYANVLAVGKGFTTPPDDLATARNAAQTLANSLEILGDAEPTQANYDQVRNTFDVNAAIGQLQQVVTTLDRTLR
jgi:hypothetical protein